MAQRNLVIFLSCFLFVASASAKVFERCELAKELKNVHGAPWGQLATWVCLAANEANYNTAKIKTNSNGSKDHGIFQVNDKYWCYPPGNGCGVPCSALRDDKIADDYQCAQKIFKETEKSKGDGFKAWAQYEKFCKGSKADEYIKGCFQ